jgi:hypothetical protein
VHKTGKKAKVKSASAGADEFNEPIVVSFRGMFKDPAGKSTPLAMQGSFTGDEPTVDDLLRDSRSKQIEKLTRLADHYGLDRSGPEGWGLHLALRIATEHHPGFRVVYDDWPARLFFRLYGFTPLYPLKGKDPKIIRSNECGWARLSKILQPEMLAMLVKLFKKKDMTNEQICEMFVLTADEKMKQRKNLLERKRRTATLIRRLTEGQKRFKNKDV